MSVNRSKAGRPFYFDEDESINTDAAFDNFSSAISSDSYTNTPQAIQAAYYMMNSSEAEGGVRRSTDVVRIVVLLTDGNPNQRWETDCGDIKVKTKHGTGTAFDPKDIACTEYQAARLINDFNAYLVYVRIGSEIDENFLSYCVDENEPLKEGGPSAIRSINSTFDQLQYTIDEIVNATCIDEVFAVSPGVTFRFDLVDECRAYIRKENKNN